MSEPKTSVRRVKATEKQRQALELRKAGASYDEIARKIGYSSKSGAYKSVTSALSKMLKEPAEELRTLEMARLDRLLVGVWSAATQGNQGAIDRVLRILERRAKLLGLDAPQRRELSGPDGGPIETIDARSRLLASIEREMEAPEAAAEEEAS